jgi:hypothetical protein
MGWGGEEAMQTGVGAADFILDAMIVAAAEQSGA